MMQDDRDARHGAELVAALRDPNAAIINLRRSAADEIERLLAQSSGEPIEQARYHLQKADHALHDVEGDPYADEAHRLVHEAAFMITDDRELQSLRKLPAQSDAEPFEHCPMCGKDEDHEHNDAEVSEWLTTQYDATALAADIRQKPEFKAMLARSDIEDYARSLEKENAELLAAVARGREGFMAACYKFAETLRARAADLALDAADAADKPIGFRTNDVPYPYAEGSGRLE